MEYVNVRKYYKLHICGPVDNTQRIIHHEKCAIITEICIMVSLEIVLSDLVSCYIRIHNGTKP